MAPKKSSKPKVDDAAISEKDREAAVTSRRLQEAALHAGIYARTSRLTGKELKHSAVLLKADGKDIVKKSSVRKGRYLININAQLAPAAAGRLGSLAQLDTKNPVMYLDFPNGRLKFFGTLVFPENKYLGLKFGPKEVLCEDAFESMVVFAEVWWIGTAVENPSEQQMPMPAELQTVKLHDESVYQLPGSEAGADKSGGSQQPTPDEEEDRSDSLEDGGVEGEGAGPSSQRPMRAAAAGKRPRYNEDGDGNSSSSGSDSEDGDAAPSQKLPKIGAATPASQRKLPPAPQAARKAAVREQPSCGRKSDDPQDEAKAKQSKLGSFFSKVPGKNKAGVPYKIAPTKLVASSQEELTGAVPASTKSSISKRAAAVLAATKLVSAKESSSEEGDDEEDDEVIQISSGSEKSSPVVRKRAGRRLVIPQVESDEVESEENESSSEDEDSD